MALAEDICESWGWAGVESAQVVRVNKFGNVIFVDQAAKYWRICPEELECKVIAESATSFNQLLNDPDFISDWEMTGLVEMAEAKYGPQPVHRCFCLKTPGVLGGAYEIENIGTIRIGELIRFSGDVANQIRDLPDGGKVVFKIVD